ncbi:MAG: TetR/AcrR family transcriptional regulator [Acidobacteriota bacterium]|nr:TetR/AcrR family transcriptional regulator [Acidobacteriota bacterium]
MHDPSTRDKILEAARQLFWDGGYEATSLQQIAQDAGVHPGSVYYFFRTKEDILLAVLDWYLENLEPILIEPLFSSVSDPIERITGLLAGYRMQLVATGFTRGCPIGNLALQVGRAIPRAQEKVRANFAGWKAWVGQCVREAASGAISEEDVASAATFVLTVMEGAVMQSLTEASIEPFDQCVRELRRYLAASFSKKEESAS